MAERGVKNNIVYSSEMPRIWVKVSENFKYIGNIKFILMDAAWVDIYYFVEADGAALKRTFHVQFEGYLPNNDHVYHYPSEELVPLGGVDYQYDAAFGSQIEAIQARPTGDMAQGYRLLQDKGYDADGMNDVMRERYVRLLDDAKRNEVLLIYTENLALYGLTANDLDEGGKAAAMWPRLVAEMHERSKACFQVCDEAPPQLV